MSIPYTVTVTSLDRGWVYVSTQGDPSDPDADAVLVDPLNFSWAFTDEQIPGQINPFTASVNFAGRTAADLPVTLIGDLINLDVRIETGPRLIQQNLRVTSAEVALTSPTQSDHPARLTVALVDTSVDWRARVPVITARTLREWAGKIAEVGALIGVPVGCPDTWAVDEGPTGTTGYGAGPTGSEPLGPILQYPAAQESLTRLLQSHVPDGDAHAFTGIYLGTWPTGYDYVGDHDPATYVATPTEPAGPVRAVLAPSSRRTTSSALPLVFAVTGSLLTVVAGAPITGGSTTQVAIPACWCVLPAQARQARDQAVNTIQVEGNAIFETDTGTADIKQESGDYTHTAVDGTDVGATGSRVRNLQTFLEYAIFDDTGAPYATHQAAYDTVTDAFMSDDTAQAASWAYDAFTLHTREMTPTEAEDILPIIAPRVPGEDDGDGRLVRHLTIFGVADELRLEGGLISGFVTSGSLDIFDGEMTWTLTMTPGRPIYAGSAPTPVTFAEMEALATTHGLTAADIDPSITFADLDYVDA